MIQEMITGIAGQLRTVYPEESYQIYSEAVEQNLTRPCFFILPLVTEQVKQIGPRYRREQSFQVQYFPLSSDGAYQEMDQVADRLFQLLEYITVSGDLLRGSGMRYEKVDGVLQFSVQYNFYLRVVEEEDAMDGLSVKNSMKG